MVCKVISSCFSVIMLPAITLLLPVCLSPKLPIAAMAVRAGDELKLVFEGQPAHEIARWESLSFRHFLLQPEWGARYERLLAEAIALLQAQPRWRLSLQSHKLLGLP